jgi:hypothetical protein
MKLVVQFQENKEKRGGGHGWAATRTPAPTLHGLGGTIRCIVGASGERMRWVGPCGRPSDVHPTPTSLFEMYCGLLGRQSNHNGSSVGQGDPSVRGIAPTGPIAVGSKKV